MAPKSYEGGIRPYRIEFVRESTEGVAPSNPAWVLYSDNVRTFEPEINPQTEAQRGLGSADPVAHRQGTEQTTMTVAYDLQQWLTDGSGNAQDAAYDGVARDADERLPNTHTVVRRMDQSDLDAANTVNGSTSYDTRQYFVGKGGSIATVTPSGDPSNPQPDRFELEYEFERGWLYQIDQPSSSTELVVSSTDSNDTMDITIEDEGAGTTETVTLSGTSIVSTSSTFADIDAAELSAEAVGTVTVAINSGSSTSPTEGDALLEIQGQSDFDHGEGTLGVPALGTGSHASAIGSDYAIFHRDTVERPSGTALADNVMTVEGSIENNLDPRARGEGPRRAIVAGNRASTLEATVFGETEHYQATLDAMRGTATNVVWTFIDTTGTTLGTITWDSAVVQEAGGAEEVGQGVKEVELTLASQGVTVS